MNSPSVPLPRFIVVSSSIVLWIAAVAIALKTLYGAEANMGWLIVGIMFSAVIFGAFLMTRDLFHEVEKPVPGHVSPWHLKRKVGPRICEFHRKFHREKRLASRSHRIVLGLNKTVHAPNRRKRRARPRTNRRRGYATLRFNPV